MLVIDANLAKKLIEEQFPKWADLPISPVEKGGHDNRTFHLGDSMSIRLPSAKPYVAQVEKENKWLPYLGANLNIPISLPLAKGKPSNLYPWPWSVMKWIEGETASRDRVKDLKNLALDLAGFLKDLQDVDTLDAPLAGKHNFYRGGPLGVYDKETRDTIALIQDYFDKNKLLDIWEKAMESSWTKKPVWVHGDMAPGNILVNNQGKLSGVIDFGIMGVGDPACDLVIAWTFLDQESRELFKKEINLDQDTWDRARGWALWKALISYEEYMKADHPLKEEIARVIETILEEHDGIIGLDKDYL